MFRPPDVQPSPPDSFWSQERVLERKAMQLAREKRERDGEWAQPHVEEWQKLEIARQIALKRHNPPRVEELVTPSTRRPSLFARLKARAARVTWDSWG